MGWLQEDHLEPNLASAFRSLPVGTIGPLIETPSGVHVVEVQERAAPVATPFEEVRDQIRHRQKSLRRREVTNRLLEEVLGAQPIEIDS